MGTIQVRIFMHEMSDESRTSPGRTRQLPWLALFGPKGATLANVKIIPIEIIRIVWGQGEPYRGTA